MYRERRTSETCRACGANNHVVVCYSGDAALHKPEAEYCVACGEVIKSETCFAIFVDASPQALDATMQSFKSGLLCASLKPPAGLL
ncbi:MAG TPA: hypothetical protein VHN20_19240 [Beijerinckiaceae bacterium]|nr:hypothetical protein [Beijerinckiaceae bacterium]